MNEKHINEFIDKAIQKTKNAELHWQAIPNDFIINPLPDDDSGSTSIVINAKELYANYSYIASYKMCIRDSRYPCFSHMREKHFFSLFHKKYFYI